MAQTAGGTYYAASSELVSSWPATSLDLANQLETRFAAKVGTSPTASQTITNAGAVSDVPLNVVGKSGQTGNIFRVGSNAGAEFLAVDKDGLLTGQGTSLGSWTSYTPTITAGTGTFTTVTGSGRYCRLGKTVHVVIFVNITTNGTAGSFVNATLPIAAANTTPYVGTGRANSISGKQLYIRVPANSSTAGIYNYDGTYPGATGEGLAVCLTYEIA